MRLFSLEGKTALITGSSGGLGLTIAEGLAEAGAHVILNGRNTEKLDSAIKKIKDKNYGVDGISFDVTNEEEIEHAVTSLFSTYENIDILVNNAGINLRGSLEELETDTWQKVIDTNLTSVFKLTKKIAPKMIENKKGKIINTCSLMSKLGRSTTGAYTASKGGLQMLTQAMTADWGKYNIQINGIGPGYFITEMTQSLADNKEFSEWLQKRTP